MTITVMDDCSPQDPKLIVDTFLPGSKYVRLDRRYGGRVTRSKDFDHLPDNTDIIFMMSSDVLLLDSDYIEKSVNLVRPGRMGMGLVRNLPVPRDYYLQPQFKKDQYTDKWNSLTKNASIYCGPDRADDLVALYAGAITVKDAISVGFKDEDCCDAVTTIKMVEHKMKAAYDRRARAIHQAHPYIQHPCPAYGGCKYQGDLHCTERGIRKLA